MVYLIKDLAWKTGYSIHTLKYYLKLGLVQETGRSPETRFRYFDEQTVAHLARIRELRRTRHSLADIRRLLQDLPAAPQAGLTGAAQAGEREST